MFLDLNNARYQWLPKSLSFRLNAGPDVWLLHSLCKTLCFPRRTQEHDAEKKSYEMGVSWVSEDERILSREGYAMQGRHHRIRGRIFNEVQE
jgi:hypothetical protein